MQLVERHIVLKDKLIEDICYKAKNLYNFTLYNVRQSVFGKLQYFTEYEFTGLCAEFNDPDYRALPAQTAQQIIKLVFKNFKSWQKAKKEYEKNPSKFTGRPHLPKYKEKKGYSIAIFTSQQISIKEGYIHFPKQTNLQPVRTYVDKIDHVRIVPNANCFIIEVVYNKENLINENIDSSKFLSIDLGMNNLTTSINNVGLPPFIVNGRVLKSVNQMFNKTKARLMSYIGDKGTSNRIKKLTYYRNNFIEDKLHKASKFIIDYCIENQIGTIVIGHNKGWKDEINIGKKNNQKFVCLPHSKLINKIKYKSERVGITVIETEESYTSKVDHLAFEEMKHHEKYMGRRKKRGLFQSSIGRLLNADVNGAIGISRKVFGDLVATQVINSGIAAYIPVKVNIF